MSLLALEIVREFLFPHRPQNAIPVLDGPWAANDRLDHCEGLITDLDRPDDVAADDLGNLYISSGGQVFCYAAPDYQAPEVVARFEGRAGGLTWHPDAGLIVCVDGEGVAFVGGPHDGAFVKSCEGEAILSPTATAVLPSGAILVAVGSRRHPCADWVWDLMEKGASGRLLLLTPDMVGGGREFTVSVLLDGLRYPAGLAALPGDRDAVIVTESWSHEVSLVERSPQGGRRQPVMSNLAGYPSRVVATPDGFWLALFALRTQLVEFVLSEDGFRLEMMSDVDPDFWIRPALRTTGHFYEPLQGGGIKQLGIMKPWAPPRAYGLVVRLDRDFEVIESLHSRVDGVRHGVTGLAASGDSLFALSQGMGVLLRHRLDE